MILSCDRICLKFWNAPKSMNFIFGSFSVLKSITCSNFEMPRFLMFENFEMPHFSYLFLKMKFIDFATFKNFKQILSHDKIICHMLFGAFQVTPRNTIRDNGHFGSQSYHDDLVIFISVKNYFKKPICSSRTHRQ